MASTGSPVAAHADELEARTRSFVREHRLPSAAVGVVHGDELVWSSGAGFADIAGRRAAGPETLYRIASITKTFTGTAVMQLRDEGRLHLDDPAVAHLPELRNAQSPFGSIETVTIRRMLSHESGLVGDPPGTDWASATYEASPAANLARAGEIGTTVPPSTQQKYSNLAYQLLGEIVTRVSGVPYRDHVRTQILEPLGMAATAFEPLSAELGARRATGYAPRWFSDDLVESVTAPFTEAEGGLWSCVADLARWVVFQLREDGGTRTGAQVLAGETLAEMHRPRYLGDEAWTEAWCIAWYAIRRQDVIWVQHSGGLHGFTTNVCFDPRERVGAIALVNGAGEEPDSLAMDLAGIARDAVRAAPAPIEPPVSLPHAWRELLGLYAEPETMLLLRLEWRDGKLTFVDADSPSWRPTLAPGASPDAFVVEPGVREAGEPCTFERTAGGGVRAVVVGSTRLRRLEPVE
ncbi:MAG TPA: serine hydrolase domain-containing protein [Gaiellales bacterium]|nr:serine hydrolase domain-containing protein [Gaiellales bacterium]